MPAAEHLDLALARRILRGDEREFRSLFETYYPRLYRFALVRLRGDTDAAGEVVQQTFCRAIEKLDSYRGEAALYTWFCQICRNTIVDFCRARRRDWQSVRPMEDEAELRAIIEAVVAPPNSRPETQAWQRDVRRLVQATVDALPAHYGNVLEWKYVDGLSVNDIAARLSIGSKAAESLLTRAREAFRDAMLTMAEIPEILHPPRSDP
jgi:RNA polymerase sigma-70 factor, ECF subfamily